MNLRTTGKLFKRHYNFSAIQSRFKNVESLNTQNSKYFHIHANGLPSEINRDDLIIIPDFINKEEEKLLFKSSLKKLKRLASYETAHEDKVITNYRECQVSNWLPQFKEVHILLERFYNLFPLNKQWLPLHILELSKDGFIKPHVDNDLSGSIIAGLCLNSPCVINFEQSNNPDITFDMLTVPRCLYIQRNTVRYKFAHGIPNSDEAKFKDDSIPRQDRITLMFRVT